MFLAKGRARTTSPAIYPSPFRDMVPGDAKCSGYSPSGRPMWRLHLSAVRAAVKAGLGVTARPVEMMSPDFAC